MTEEILNLQMISVEEEADEVDGMRLSTISGGGCGNWSVLSIAGC
ncbi:SapB/AmfS family lantipeptide [Streptococcus porcinus]|uniref:SapB/AmfS family lantipeptide n=1 Tax=Streptococcus porcinus TaxID=1340 RepID=A0A7V9WR22_STRPO|nr:SapB/AmfS family lantipeptide [Streptococcus porcinus]MBA2795517.1 SapB/AmfS family lantipeptide [Streptococcus porcinus]